MTQVGISWSTATIALSDTSLNWLRLIEISGSFYYIGASYSDTYLMKAGSTTPVKLELAAGVIGSYPYVAAPRGGTSLAENYVDALLICGPSSGYPNATNFYLRIAKSEFDKL
ncbi:MAG: hypothetical protein HY547_08370 [Elusimicrobia bacterium]|nr:hypothetical protein [Elusimicrobiota bacterium]